MSMNPLDPFESNVSESGMPGMTPGVNSTSATIIDNYKYRIGYYQLGGGGDGSGSLDQLSELENLLTLSIRPDRRIIIVSRKESISATTGMYTVVVTYLEKTINA